MTDAPRRQHAIPGSDHRRRRWQLFACLLIFSAPLGCSDGNEASVRPAPGPAPAVTPWLTEITEEVGLKFAHESGASGAYHVPEVMGSGAVLFDADGDGDLDIYLLNGNGGLPDIEPSQTATNRMYRQEDDGIFVDVTESSGLGDGGYGQGAAVGDIDNDGDLDLFLTNFGRDRLYRNRGDGVFDDITTAADIDVPQWSCSAAFFDYDRDGYLDLFITGYLDYDPGVERHGPVSTHDYLVPATYEPIHDVLLHNNGNGTFTDVSAAAGIASARAAGLGVVCEDFDEDGWIDVYVTNDAYGNHLWKNNGDGTFTDIATIMGCAYNLHAQPEAGMGVVAADFDNDLDLDLFMTHSVTESNTLYMNLGGTRGFSDVTGRHGLAASSMRLTGFGTVAIDIEHDGDLDLLAVNGRVERQEVEPGALPDPPWNAYAEPNLLYLNDGRGGFELRNELGGAYTRQVEVTRGLASGDIDDDGDLDLILSNIQGRARIFRNDTPDAGNWVLLRAIDPSLRRDAVGARITLSSSGRLQRRTIHSTTSYLSGCDMRAHFGLGDAQTVDWVEVAWVDGLVERFEAPAVNRFIVIERGSGEARR